MFSRALYKQSWKANWIQWLSVVIVSVFVLVIIMLMSGGEGINNMTTAFTNTFGKESLQSGFQNTSINYHYVANESLLTFDEAFMDGYVNEIVSNPYQAPTEESIGNVYLYAINQFENEVEKRILEIDPSYVNGTPGYEELYGAAMLALNPNGAMNFIFELYEPGSTPLDYDVVTLIDSISFLKMLNIWITGNVPTDLYDVIHTLERTDYRFDRSRNSSSTFLAGNMSSSEAKVEILEALKKANISEETYDTFGFDYDGLKSIANTAIVTFQARLDFEISQLNIGDFEDNEAYLTRISEIKVELQTSITATILTKLPSELSDSLGDMKNQDMYSMIVAGLYFKIIALLISVVYVIVVGINLIVGQVDSGSMAYILSTGTERDTVTLTQMVFYIGAALLLSLATTITSVVCFIVAPPAYTTVTLSDIIIFNIGAFFVTLALSGIMFMASCIFNRSKRAVALGGGFAVLTLVFTILGMFANENTPSIVRMDSLNFFNMLSVSSLFDVTSIIHGTIDHVWKFGILILIAVVTFGVGAGVFKKKDLPL